jgi:hypothetical protein
MTPKDLKKEVRNEALVDTYHMIGIVICFILISISAFF